MLNEKLILEISYRFIRNNNYNLTFGQVVSEQQYQQLGVFRLQTYRHKNSYMLNEMNEQGLDEQDYRGAVYAAWLENELIASIRLCGSPFESGKFLSDDTLRHFLGDNYDQEYLEWTRLLIQPRHKVIGLLPALIAYAGLKTLSKQSCHKYFGYSTTAVKRLFSRFLLSKQSFEFTIPKRGEHKYTLIKGDFALDFLNLENRCKES